MTNDCGELLKSLKDWSEAAQLETTVNLTSAWQVHLFWLFFSESTVVELNNL